LIDDQFDVVCSSTSTALDEHEHEHEHLHEHEQPVAQPAVDEHEHEHEHEHADVQEELVVVNEPVAPEPMHANAQDHVDPLTNPLTNPLCAHIIGVGAKARNCRGKVRHGGLCPKHGG
jgi:hypothetical protein